MRKTFPLIPLAGLLLLAQKPDPVAPKLPDVGGNVDVDAGGDVRLWDGHVPQTRLQLRDLGIAPFDVIPAGQTAITSLAAAPNGDIYGGTSGEMANLFVFSPNYNIVFPLGTIPGEEAIHHSLAIAPSGLVYLGTTRNPDRQHLPDEKFAKGTDWYYKSVTAQIRKDYAAYAGGHLYVYDPASTRINYLQRNFRINKPCPLKDLGIPVPNEGIYTLLLDPVHHALYGLTYPGAIFFRYDIASARTEILGTQAAFTPREEYLPMIPKVLVRDQSNRVYTSTDRSWLTVYRPGSPRPVRLDARLPGLAGREMFNTLEAGVVHPSGLIYGGTTDGFLFSFSAETGTVRNLGKPLMESRIRALTVGLDGRIYGLGGRKGGVTRLFSYNPSTHSFQDYGMIEVAMVPYYEWKGFLFDAIATGRDGSLYLGNSEHRSRLFIFNP